jgi:hypothetical protein
MNIDYMLRIRDAYRGSRIPDTGSRIRIRIRIKEVFLTLKTDTKFSKIRSKMFIPDPGFLIFFHPGSRIRIPDPGVKKAPDPQHRYSGDFIHFGAVM